MTNKIIAVGDFTFVEMKLREMGYFKDRGDVWRNPMNADEVRITWTPCGLGCNEMWTFHSDDEERMEQAVEAIWHTRFETKPKIWKDFR